MTRETEQLLAVANHYLAEAKQVLKTYPRLATMTIGEITRNHRTRSLSPAEILWPIINYDLTENYRKKFYETSGNRRNGWPLSKIKAHISAKPYEHLHLLLRDNVAHEEPGIANKRQIAKDRVAVLKETTIETCNKALADIAKAVKKWL